MLALSMKRVSEPWCARVQVLVAPKFCMMLSTLLKLYGWFSPLLNGGNASTNLKELLKDLNELVTYKSNWTEVHLIVSAQKCSVYYLKDEDYI